MTQVTTRWEDQPLITKLLFIVSAIVATEADLVHEVVCAETSFSRAAERKDKDAFIERVDPDARFVGGQVSRGRDEIAAAWAFAFVAGGADMRWRPSIVAVTSDGDLAISRGPYRMTRVDDAGATIESWGTFISTWRRDADGEWRVLFDTSGETNMTPSEQDREVLNGEPECS